MKRKFLRPIDIVNNKIHRDASQGAANMGGLPWCYFEAIKGNMIDSHPVKQLTKARRRKEKTNA